MTTPNQQKSKDQLDRIDELFAEIERLTPDNDYAQLSAVPLSNGRRNRGRKLTGAKAGRNA
jgi:hypothetical protein